MAKIIPVSGGLHAIVDDVDYERVSHYSWVKLTSPKKRVIYARSYLRDLNPPKWSLMHRFILNSQDGQEVDHQNENGLDNRRSNIRPCTESGNASNVSKRRSHCGIDTTSKFKGVSWHKATSKWRVRVHANGKVAYIEYFSDEKKAALAYNNAALKFHGDFAKLNDIS